jgi:phage shock protein A
LEKTCEQLHSENRELRDSLESLKAECERLVTAFEQLRTDLGG